MDSQETISIPFERTDGVNTLLDCLVMTQADLDASTMEEIEAKKDARFDSWLEFMSRPAVLETLEV